MEHKGYGLVADSDIFKGDLVIEYSGEVIDSVEFDRRLKYYQVRNLFLHSSLDSAISLFRSDKGTKTSTLWL